MVFFFVAYHVHTPCKIQFVFYKHYVQTRKEYFDYKIFSILLKAQEILLIE